jgi:hypothetical protein
VRLRASAAALSLLVLSSCGGGERPAPARPEAAPTGAVRPRCDVPRGRAPEGFMLARTSDRPHRDHVGVHIVYRAPDGARLDYLVGVAGEVGEGLPLVGEVELATGEPARLLGRDETWVVVWPEPPPCAQSAILGNGMDRAGFDEVLEGTGILG